MQKNKNYFYLILFFVAFSVKGQRHEIGAQVGLSNLVGDIGRTNYVLQKPVSDFRNLGFPFYGGLLYRMNFNPYQTIRFNLGYNHIQFSDPHAKEFYRSQRNLSGSNSVYEADVLFEYNFFPVNDEQKSLLSPYIFGGIGAMLANTTQIILQNDFRRDTAGNAIRPTNDSDFVTNTTYGSGSKLTMAIPFGVGLKYKFNYNWALFGEFMFRPTFSDAIDYSIVDENSVKITYNKDILADGSNTKSLLQESPYREIAEAKAAEIIQNRQVGNINSKDWINSATIGITYSFGRPPCYCE